MKWAARYRARLRSVLRHWRDTSYVGTLDGECLTINVYVSTKLLQSGDPSVPGLVAQQAAHLARRATQRRMEAA